MKLLEQWGFYFDQTRCVSCKACVLACKAWNEDKRGDAEYNEHHMKENWRRVHVTEYGSVPPNVDVLNLSISCNHCDNPVCVEVCPTKRICKEAKYGIVLIDTDKKCISCGLCKKACPWDSPQFYDNDLKKYAKNDVEKPKMTKCTLCLDRIEEGLKPACVAACLMRALDAGPIDELKQKYPEWTDEVENFPDGKNSGSKVDIKPNIIFKRKLPKC